MHTSVSPSFLTLLYEIDYMNLGMNQKHWILLWLILLPDNFGHNLGFVIKKLGQALHRGDSSACRRRDTP